MFVFAVYVEASRPVDCSLKEPQQINNQQLKTQIMEGNEPHCVACTIGRTANIKSGEIAVVFIEKMFQYERQLTVPRCIEVNIHVQPVVTFMCHGNDKQFLK